jgi:hypothetical protein
MPHFTKRYEYVFDLCFILTRVADPDPDPHQIGGNQRSMVPSRLYFEPPGLHCDCPGLYFEPLNLLSFDVNADPDPAFYSYADQDPASKKMRIRIPNHNLYYLFNGTV